MGLNHSVQTHHLDQHPPAGRPRPSLRGSTYPPAPADLSSLGIPGHTKYYRSLQALEISSFFHLRRKLCLVSPLALDFEHKHFLDRVAYHNLLGVDCFICLMDWHRSRSRSAVHALRQLARRPWLVALVSQENLTRPEHGQVEALAVRSLLRRTKAVEMFGYLDWDEWLVLTPEVFDTQRAGCHAVACQQAGTPTSIVPFLRSVLSPQHADAVYVHGWPFGSAAYRCLSSVQLAAHPAPYWFDRRTLLPQGANRTVSLERACTGMLVPYGKMIGRVQSEWELANMHIWSRGRVVLPDRRPLTTRWPNLTDPCAVMPLSFNHYGGTPASCMAKALHGWRTGNHRTVHECKQHLSFTGATSETNGRIKRGHQTFRDNAASASTLRDSSVSRYMEATRAHLIELYGPLAAHPTGDPSCT